jgi:hypothetical protein
MGIFSTFGRYTSRSSPLIWSNEFKQNGAIDINSEFLRESITKIASLFDSDSLR